MREAELASPVPADLPRPASQTLNAVDCREAAGWSGAIAFLKERVQLCGPRVPSSFLLARRRA